MPQGFFIQVFSSALFMMMNMLYDITSQGWLVVILSVVMIFATYKQLFGYGWWGTLWRVVTAFVCAYSLLSALLNINYGAYLLENGQPAAARSFFLNAPIVLALLVLILTACYRISKKQLLVVSFKLNADANS